MPILPRRPLIRLLFATLLASALHGKALAVTAPTVQATPEDSAAALWMSRVLSRYHLNPTRFDAALSEKVFARYLNELDPQHALLTQADLDQYAGARGKLGDAVNNENLSIPFALYNLVAERMTERYTFTQQELAHTPDFTLSERLPAKPHTWPEQPAQLRELWRKHIKRDWLQLRLMGESDGAIAEALNRRNETVFQRLGSARHGDVAALFLNAYVKSFDPHGAYQAPLAPLDPAVAATPPSLTGLGYTWRMTDGFPTLHGKTPPPNTPEALLQLDYGDRLLGVAAGVGQPMDSVIGLSLSEVMNKLRGPAGSTVVLDILPASAGIHGPRRRLTLTRQPIPRSALEASSTISTVTVQGKPQRVGIIKLPSFYEDAAGRKRGGEFASSTRDVARLLQGLRAQGVDTVLLDLRRNEGGALLDVFAMARLFVPQGPFGQQVGDKFEVFNPPASTGLPAWDGTLGVLISRHSAAGAEIFAAAIQDYGRGLILGEPSFANGTVHTSLSLDRFSKDPAKPYGVMQLTVSQYYRNTGHSIQMNGVIPDIAFPVSIDASTSGEATLDNALPRSERSAEPFQPVGDWRGILPQLRKQHAARWRNDLSLQTLQALAAQYASQRAQETISLNEAERRSEIAAADRQFKVLGAPGAPNLDSAVAQEAAHIVADAAVLQGQ